MSSIVLYLVVLYFVVGIMILPVFVMSTSKEDPYKLSTIDDAMTSIVFHLFWPIVISIISIVRFVKTRKDRFEQRVDSIVGHYRLEGVSPHDRSVMIVIPEADLKFLLKHYRRKKIKLKPQMVEIIREELMHRNAEKHLLR